MKKTLWALAAAVAACAIPSAAVAQYAGRPGPVRVSDGFGPNRVGGVPGMPSIPGAEVPGLDLHSRSLPGMPSRPGIPTALDVVRDPLGSTLRGGNLDPDFGPGIPTVGPRWNSRSRITFRVSDFDRRFGPGSGTGIQTDPSGLRQPQNPAGPDFTNLRSEPVKGDVPKIDIARPVYLGIDRRTVDGAPSPRATSSDGSFWPSGPALAIALGLGGIAFLVAAAAGYRAAKNA